MKFPVKVSEKEILEAATVHLGPNDSLTIDIEGMTLNFIFDINLNEKSATYTGKVDGKALTITLTNFNNPLGEGSLSPIEVGFYQKRKLYVSFFVSTLSNKERRFEYNLFLGGKHV